MALADMYGRRRGIRNIVPDQGGQQVPPDPAYTVPPAPPVPDPAAGPPPPTFPNPEEWKAGFARFMGGDESGFSPELLADYGQWRDRAAALKQPRAAPTVQFNPEQQGWLDSLNEADRAKEIGAAQGRFDSRRAKNIAARARRPPPTAAIPDETGQAPPPGVTTSAGPRVGGPTVNATPSGGPTVSSNFGPNGPSVRAKDIKNRVMAKKDGPRGKRVTVR